MARAPEKNKRLSKSQRRQLNKQQAAEARRSRQQWQQAYDQLVPQAQRLLSTLAPAFTRPTFLRFALLTIAYFLTVGPRTVCNVLRLLRGHVTGHPSGYHRFFSLRHWSSWALARLLTRGILRTLVPEGPIVLVADDTVTEHLGRHVYGKGWR